jgi:hypothetical protein
MLFDRRLILLPGLGGSNKSKPSADLRGLRSGPFASAALGARVSALLARAWGVYSNPPRVSARPPLRESAPPGSPQQILFIIHPS